MKKQVKRIEAILSPHRSELLGQNVMWMYNVCIYIDNNTLFVCER